MLCGTRQVGFSPCSLSITDIKNTLDFFGIIDLEERREYLDYILCLDTEWLKYYSASIKK